MLSTTSLLLMSISRAELSEADNARWSAVSVDLFVAYNISTIKTNLPQLSYTRLQNQKNVNQLSLLNNCVLLHKNLLALSLLSKVTYTHIPSRQVA